MNDEYKKIIKNKIITFGVNLEQETSMKKKLKKKSRHVPKKVSQAVKKRHHFECAWCGIGFTERHHIEEFSQGGEHTEGNLILLCPICHKKVHQGKISTSELITRKSTHFKCDRISSNFQSTMDKLKFKIGGTYYFDSENFLTYKHEKVLHFEIRDNRLLINLKFFNKKGDLIFWMSENYFWVSSVFSIKSKLNIIEINHNKEELIFKMEKIDDYLKITLKTFLGGEIFDFNENSTNLLGNRFHFEGHSVTSKDIFNIG